MEVSRFLGVAVRGVVVLARILSSSVLKRIQSFTRITKCGVLSLKKSGERNNLKDDCDIGKAFSSSTITVIFAIGSIISACHLETLFGGKSAPILADDVRRNLLYEMFKRRNGVTNRTWSLKGCMYALLRRSNNKKQNKNLYKNDCF